MDDKSLYSKLLGLTPPWGVEDVELRLDEGEVHIRVALPPEEQWVCPDCMERSPIHDHRERKWRHLDTFQYRTILHARVPRLKCPNHGVKQLRVPWAEDGSRFTSLFEAMLIHWLKEASVSAVSRLTGTTWDQVWGVMARAVGRGRIRREATSVRYIGIDETSEQKGHRYLTVVSDLERGKVLFVREGRREECLNEFWDSLNEEQLTSIKAVAMDMWKPYINSTKAYLPGAEGKIVFDKFHVAQHLGNAIDEVRRQENRKLLEEGKTWLLGTRYMWLRNPEKFSPMRWREFLVLARSHSFRTGRAWAIVQTFMAIYDYTYPGVAEKQFREWYRWARRSHLEPIKRVAKMIWDHWPNIHTYFRHRITNAGAEGINSLIQKVKRKAHGFRNSENFKIAIYFHLGDLDLLPYKLPRGDQA